jgi:acyl carrier protein|tara:strand:- start:608 stop:850 length:243 start_codon:yes stop_codon:yes gene_type:complete
MEKKLHNEIFKIFKKSLELKNKKISKNLNKKNLQEWDSMSNMALISNIEKKFQLKFNVDEVLKINSVANLLKIVQKKIKS